MMNIHLPTLPRICILVVLLLNTLTGLFGASQKTLVDLDISVPRQARFATTPSSNLPGGTHYTIKPSSRHTHIIGMVRDAEEVLVEGDPTAVSRYVLVHPRGDGIMYIRVITRRIPGERTTQIIEFMRRPEDAHYAPIIRTPIELDILSMDNTQYMDINVIPGQGSSEAGGSRQLLPSYYSVKPQFWLTHTIGIIRYGRVIIEKIVHGLMERSVIWGGVIGEPLVTIVSKYDNGTEITMRCRFLNGGFKLLEYKSKLVELRK